MLERLSKAVPSTAIPGIPDLMHHKYVVRDGATVWTGSTNWTHDAWTRMENLILTVQSTDLAAAYTQDFEQLWTKRHLEHTARSTTSPRRCPEVPAFGHSSHLDGEEDGPARRHRIGQARDRIRICSPVITSSPILGTLAEVLDDNACDALITVDGPQMAQALEQWHSDGRASWKVPLYERVVRSGSRRGQALDAVRAEPRARLHARQNSWSATTGSWRVRTTARTPAR